MLRAMERLPTRIDSESQEFIRCNEKNIALVDDLREKLAKVKLGGGEKYVERHRSRNKKLARERISDSCDPGTPAALQWHLRPTAASAPSYSLLERAGPAQIAFAWRHRTRRQRRQEEEGGGDKGGGGPPGDGRPTPVQGQGGLPGRDGTLPQLRPPLAGVGGLRAVQGEGG